MVSMTALPADVRGHQRTFDDLRPVPCLLQQAAHHQQVGRLVVRDEDAQRTHPGAMAHEGIVEGDDIMACCHEPRKHR